MSILQLIVNESTRKLSNRSSNQVFVVNDANVDTIRFSIPAGFSDIDIDKNASFRVMYIPPGIDKTVYAKTLTFVQNDGVHISYDWQVGPNVLVESGILTVSFCILKIEPGLQEWHTIPYQIPVSNTIHTDDSDEADETITPTVAERVAVLESMIQRVASGAPIVVASTSAMTDTDQIYVLSTNGRWYYHNGSTWVAGGTYGAVATDTTLTQAGIPADAKAAGDAISSIEPGLSLDAKRALMVCLDNLEWANGDGKTYKNALKRALQLIDKSPNLPAEYEQVEYIEATGTQYIRTDILSQIPFRVVGDMKLSGTTQPAAVGGGVSSVSASRFFMLACPYDSGASRLGNRFANDSVTWTEDGTTYTSGWLNIRSMQFKKTARYTVESSIEYSQTSGKVNTSISCNGYSVSGQRNAPTVGYPIYFFYQSNADTPTAGTLYSCKFYSGSTLIFDAVPCYRKSDNVAGIYDVIGNKFYTNVGTGEFNIGEIVV